MGELRRGGVLRSLAGLGKGFIKGWVTIPVDCYRRWLLLGLATVRVSLPSGLKRDEG